MSIDTQKLREQLQKAGAPTLYIRTNRHPETDGRPWGWVSEHPPGSHGMSLSMEWTRGEKSDYRAQLLVSVVNGLPALLDHIDAQAAEIERQKVRADTAAKEHGWAEDQGTRAQAQTALAYYQRRVMDAQTAEIARLRDGIEEAIRLLGMDRPIDPTGILSAALSGEGK